MLRVRDIMTREVPVRPPQAAPREAVDALAERRVRGMLLGLGATILLAALLGFGWVGTALVLRPTRISVRAVRPTAALLALGPAELLGAAPAFAASSRAGAQQP